MKAGLITQAKRNQTVKRENSSEAGTRSLIPAHKAGPAVLTRSRELSSHLACCGRDLGSALGGPRGLRVEFCRSSTWTGQGSETPTAGETGRPLQRD